VTSNATTTSESVQTAFRLGWRLAQAYNDPPPASPPKADPSADSSVHLPGASERSKYELGQALIAQILKATADLGSALGTALEVVKPHLSDLAKPDVAPDTTKTTLLAVHAQMWTALGAEDAHLSTALDLGRMLADTVLLSRADHPDTLVEEFNRYRLANAYGWLNDLHRLFPHHAADAVGGSLELWQGWVAERNGVTEAPDQERVNRAIHAQGETWRRLLSGEQLAADFLTARDYETAGNRMTKRFLALLRSYLWTWRWVVVAFLVVVTVVVCATVRLAPPGAATVAALIATAAGSLGASWKTLGSTLGRVTAKAEAPLWKAEVREAMVLAVTKLPKLGKQADLTTEGR